VTGLEDRSLTGGDPTFEGAPRTLLKGLFAAREEGKTWKFDCLNVLLTTMLSAEFSLLDWMTHAKRPSRS
jgi:hypothetical protein